VSKILNQNTDGVRSRALDARELMQELTVDDENYGKVIVGTDGTYDGEVMLAKDADVVSAQGDIDDHIADIENPHSVTAEQVGLGDVDNTSDADKPISTDTQAALDTKANVSDTYSISEIDNKIKANFVSSGVINKQDDALLFNTVAGNEYKMANTDRFVNFDGKVIDTYGPELVTNGDFSDGTTGWTISGADVSISEGVAKFRGTSTNASEINSYPSSNNHVIISLNMVNHIKGSLQVAIYDTNDVKIGDDIIDSNTRYEKKFNSISRVRLIRSQAIGDYKFDIDNISVREIKTIDMTNNMLNYTIQDQATNGLVVQSSVNAGDFVVVDKEELVTNGGFDSDTNWSKGTGWSILDGKAVYTGTEYNTLQPEVPINTVNEVKYTVTLTVSGSNVDGLQVGFMANKKTGLGDGKHTFTLTSDGGNFIIRAGYNTTRWNGQIDNISVQLASDVYRAKEDIPALTSLTDSRFEDRTQYGITNKILATMKDDGTIKKEVCFVDTDIKDCKNAHIVMTDNGYSKLSNGLYSKNGDIVTPIGTWSTLNKGAFHPVYNYFGTSQWKESASGEVNWWQNWYQITGFNIISTSNSFNPALSYVGEGKLTSSTDSGHPQGKFYDIIYPDQWIDLRIEANAISESDELNRVGTKAKSGQLDGIGGVVATLETSLRSGANYAYRYSDNKWELYMNDASKANLYVGQTIEFQVQDEGRVRGIITGTFADDASGAGSLVLSDTCTELYGTFVNGYKTSKVMVSYTLPHPSSGTALRTDIIGDPANYPQEWKDRLASGLPLIGMNPLLVDDSGNSLIPDGSRTLYPISSKRISTQADNIVINMDGLYTTNNTQDQSSFTIPNTLAIRRASDASDLTNSDFALASYTAKIPTTQVSDPKAVKLVGNYVTATNSHSIYKGNQLVPTGKVNVGNGTNGFESRVVENSLSDLEYDGVLTANVVDSVVQNGIYKIYGFDLYNDGLTYVKRLGIDNSSITLSNGADLGSSIYWELIEIPKPTHSTISLDNSNSSAVKFIETIAEDEDGMAHYQVFAQEMEFNATDGDYADDIPTFPNLTNGTADNLLGTDRVKTVVASIPLNKYI